MRCPIEPPEASASENGERLIVGGLWGTVSAPQPAIGQPWVEWTAERATDEDDVPTVVLGRE